MYVVVYRTKFEAVEGVEGNNKICVASGPPLETLFYGTHMNTGSNI